MRELTPAAVTGTLDGAGRPAAQAGDGRRVPERVHRRRSTPVGGRRAAAAHAAHRARILSAWGSSPRLVVALQQARRVRAQLGFARISATASACHPILLMLWSFRSARPAVACIARGSRRRRQARCSSLNRPSGRGLEKKTHLLGAPALTSAAIASLVVASRKPRLGLGRLAVQSALGESLQAEIDVTSMTPEEAANLRIRVAPPESYRAASVDYNAVLPSTRVTLQSRPDGASSCASPVTVTCRSLSST